MILKVAQATFITPALKSRSDVFFAKNEMSPLSRGLMAAAGILIIAAYFFPLWKITLDAPQFPEGLEMYIHVNKMSGSDENTLQNVNILNHYIGMKKIEPGSIPELKIIPMVLGVMIALAFLIAVLKKRWMMAGWLLLMIIAGVVGIYDFYTWLYDYGHNLDPRAPIKIEGMVYQPPLLGTKWLLNFKSTSFPYIGSAFIGAACALVSGGIVYDWFKTKNK